MVSSLLYHISFITFVGSIVWTLLVYKLLCIKPTPRKYDKCVDRCTIIYTTKASGWSLITHPDQTPRTCVWCILQFNIFYFGIRLYSKNIVLPPLEFINFDKVEYFCKFDPKKISYWNCISISWSCYSIFLVLGYIQRKFKYPHLTSLILKMLKVFAILTPPTPPPKIKIKKNILKLHFSIRFIGYIQRKFYYHHVNSLILKKKKKWKVCTFDHKIKILYWNFIPISWFF